VASREVREIQRGITGANPIIWDATDGRFLISRVTIWNGLKGTEDEWKAADVQVHPDNLNGTIPEWYRAAKGGIAYQGVDGNPAFPCPSPLLCKKPDSEREGYHLVMSQSYADNKKDMRIDATAADPRWSHTFAHEMMHYALGLEDEYESVKSWDGTPEEKACRWERNPTHGQFDSRSHRPVYCGKNYQCYSGGDRSLGEFNATLMSGGAAGDTRGYELSVESDRTKHTRNTLYGPETLYSCYVKQWDETGGSAWRDIHRRFRADVDLQMVESSPGTFDPAWRPRSGPFEPVGDWMQ
jgi:hypothetical protein